MSNLRRTMPLFILFLCMVSCAPRPHERAVPITVIVGPIISEAPVTKSTQIYTFEEDPDRDYDLTHAQVQSLGQQAGADHVVTGLIHDYGRVRWQYWVTGWLAYVAVATTIVGFATAWNPAAIGAYLAVNATTDFPLWYGGAEIFGWALRPVRAHLGVTQIRPCSGEIWSHDELMIKVPGKLLEQYPEDQQHLKQVQLEANLHRTLEDLTAEAGDILEVRPCREDQTAAPSRSFSWASIFDLLL